jgi:hypothetical protein
LKPSRYGRQQNPYTFIEEFQKQNSLQVVLVSQARVGALAEDSTQGVACAWQVVPEATPALQFLDILGLSRPEVYKRTFEHLRAKLEGRWFALPHVGGCAPDDMSSRALQTGSRSV